ncbi:sensor histidine kinase [Streptomyces pseudovenezuelae]|uniref:sensor histidine kinase n=1 Tax=Streptomyces pseudovenezuelae TaxID=67350 RepID=UPI002476056F|nr:nitrate- and nitrite sensing domain-containing protein [Streptomyces pseudovenezuelae]
MQKTRPRRTGKQAASTGSTEHAPQAVTGNGRPTHVRNRLIVAVAVVAAAVAGAGAPSVVAASGQLSDSQDLVTFAEQTQDALALAHSLADERDEVTSYVAAGRPKSKAPSEDSGSRVDRQVEDLRADTDLPADLRSDLDGIATLRRAALTGQSSALEAHNAYSAAITELHRLAEELAERMPTRASSGGYALAELDSAVQQAAAARGLLLAALNVPRSTQSVISPVTGLPTTTTTSSAADAKTRDALSAAAQQARLRSDSALADFRDTAPKTARESYDSTVTGAEVNSAEKYLASLTDQPTLTDAELSTSVKKTDAALSARVDLMRGAESALYERRSKELAQLRDDDVTALEIRIAALGALVLLTIGIATAMARTLTRPLSVLRRGSARLAQAENPAAEEPVTFTGRNDEFAQVVRSVNALHAHAVAHHERVTTLESDRKHLVGQRQRMADAREELRTEVADSAAQLERLRASIGGTFVNLALRTLGLVERQLTVIESLEEREQDPDRLSTLFKLDHFATVMRRHSENLLVLAGTEHVQQSAVPVPLVDVVRAAVSEIERYERVRIAALPPHAHVAGFAADDLSHLLAELMENATSFSPPDRPVEVSGWLLESGEVMLSVQDEGIGMAADRMTRLNTRLAEFDPGSPYDQEGEDGLGLGLYVVARLAHRHGTRVQLREQKQGGVAAVVVVPSPLLASAPTAAVPATASSSSSPVPGGTHTFSLPGADAEANSNVLHARPKPGDLLVALAEKAMEHAETDTEPQPTTEPGPRAESPSEMTMELLVPTPTPESPAAPASPSTAAAPTDPSAAAAPTDPSAAAAPTDPSAAAAPASPSAAAAPASPSSAAALASPSSAGAPANSLSAAAPAHPSSGAAPAYPSAADGESAPQGPPAPDNESRTGGAGGNNPAEGEAEADHTRTPDGPGPDDEDPVTAKGLPKRTPKITVPTQTPRQRNTGVDAEALRRRLGGFRQGAQAGHRDVQAEIAEQTGQTQQPASGSPTSEEATGGTVEEASS